MTPLTRNPPTFVARSRKVRAAIVNAAQAGKDWPIGQAGAVELREAIALLGYVLRELDGAS